MLFNKKRNLVLAAALIFAPFCIFAADATSKSENTIGGYNILFLTLVGLILILLYFIGMLANTLRVLSEILKEKYKKDRKASSSSSVLKTLLALVVLSVSSMQLWGAEAAAAADNSPKFIAGIPEKDYYLMIGFIIFELVIIFSLAIFIRILSKTLKGKYDIELGKPVVQKNWFWDDFNAAVPIEKERDLLLDHDYDGIQELDNSLPPWWKYGFYLTIVVAIIYVYRFHVSGDGQSQEQEYVAEMQKGEEDKAAYLLQAGNNVDENSVTLLTDAAAIGEGKELFAKNCVACHLADGGGSVGPNLTDEYWIHGGGIKDIFKTIKYGWQEKGMKSWKDDFSPKQIQEIASFVHTLKGTKPAVPKAAQGELYIEAGAPALATDSTKKVAADTTASAVIKK